MGQVTDDRLAKWPSVIYPVPPAVRPSGHRWFGQVATARSVK
jgi:hypothetical protein